MNGRPFLGCTLAALVFVAGPAPVSAQASAPQALIQLERDWEAAFQAKDMAFLGRVLAEEFIATYGDGARGDKAKELALTAAFNQQVDSSSLDDFTVKVYGDTAVVWFTKRMTGPSRGQTIMVAYRYVDVFVRRDGRWQCVSSQSTKVTS